MDNNFKFNAGNGGQKNPMELIGLACAAGGCALVFLFNIITCWRSATVSFEKHDFQMSWAIIGVIIGAIVAIAGAVLSFLAAGSIRNLGMIGKIAIIVAAAALVFAFFPNVTICAYNCTLDNLN